MIITTKEIYCDSCELPIDGDAPDVQGHAVTNADMRRSAKSQGWSKLKGDDLCPKCTTQSKGGKPKCFKCSSIMELTPSRSWGCTDEDCSECPIEFRKV